MGAEGKAGKKKTVNVLEVPVKIWSYAERQDIVYM